MSYLSIIEDDKKGFKNHKYIYKYIKTQLTCRA